MSKDTKIGMILQSYGTNEPPKKRNSYLYTVYRNDSETPLITNANAKECAEAMGITLNCFRGIATRYNKPPKRRYTERKWRIEKKCITKNQK